jgi:hypothetical protein
VQTIMTGWHEQCGIIGGFMWIYDDIVGTGLAAQYAAAINTAVSSSGFTLSGPSSVFLNQNSTAGAVITIKDFGGFNGNVTLSVSGLPKGVQSVVRGTGNEQKVVFKGSPAASTGFSTVTITGTSGTFTQSITTTLAVSAATGSTGAGTQVDLSPYFTLYGIYTDGSTYTTGGLDGDGYSYSANLLGASRVLNKVLFDFGPSNAPDAVASNGQTISLPALKAADLVLFGTGTQGNQVSQTLTVTYTDGTSTKFTQSFSDWYAPSKFPREYEAVAMPYRNFDDGTKDNRTFSLYAYLFPLNKAKTVQSITLPSNPDVVVLGATLLP